jgi:hypothetical protein
LNVLLRVSTLRLFPPMVKRGLGYKRKIHLIINFKFFVE